jgi:H+/Cl- antiporter ClcA
VATILKERPMRHVKAVLTGLVTSIAFGVCGFILRARNAVSQLERETGGTTGAVLIGISQLYVPLGLGFAFGFWWIWRRTRPVRTS